LTLELARSILFGMLRRLALPILTVLLLMAAAVPASAAAGRRPLIRAHRIAHVSVRSEGRGSVIAVTYSGRRKHVRFLHSAAPIDRVALRDVDNDGQPDIIAAPHEGEILLWHNRGHGSFTLAVLPRPVAAAKTRGPGFRAQPNEAGWQWGDLRYGAAMPRAPAIVASVPVSFVRTPVASLDPPDPFRPLSGRAPPSA